MKENGCYEKFEELSRQGRRELIRFLYGENIIAADIRQNIQKSI